MSIVQTYESKPIMADREDELSYRLIDLMTNSFVKNCPRNVYSDFFEVKAKIYAYSESVKIFHWRLRWKWNRFTKRNKLYLVARL